MKAPDFWCGADTWASRVLTPFGFFYRMAGLVRRAMVKPYVARVPVICVGNVVAGGAGKTPVALALGNILKGLGASPVFVSRGYGGSKHGPLRVDPERHTAREVGDEALLLARVAPCWIGRNRAAAVRAAEKKATHIILDDGLQNPSVAPNVSFLVIDGERGVGNGKIIPAGPLRERLEDALPRVDVVVMIGDDLRNLAFNLGKPVLRGDIRELLPDDFAKDVVYFPFAGIGCPDKFFAACRLAGLEVSGSHSFPDHHMFSEKELNTLEEHACKRGLRMITTAKDYVRLPMSFRPKVSVLPVEFVFEDEEAVVSVLKTGKT